MTLDLRPRKIALYTASRLAKKSASQVRALTGADVVINGTLYNATTWKPVCDVKKDGKVLSNDAYSYRGLAWNNGDDRFTVATTCEMAKYDNFISCVMLVYQGKACQISCTSDVARPSGRTAIIGMKDGTLRLYAVKEGVRNRTPQELQKTVLAMGGVDYCLMLDGGGSTQLSQAGNEYICSSRKVQNYLCFWKRDNEPKGERPMVEINAYSKKKDGAKKLSTNFAVREFACKDGSDAILVAPRLVMVLQSIRSHFGKPVTIHSAYRTAAYNDKVGGAAQSQHCYGTAADVSIKGVAPSELADYARSLMPDWGGVGVYPTFTHVDVRETRADWKG
ncbi:MAG: phosphodiester glycosidase family protein [Oscillibacter sp.]|nr:phosphodiester glycosidase family protein [Oscillibacter sp.]